MCVYEEVEAIGLVQVEEEGTFEHAVESCFKTQNVAQHAARTIPCAGVWSPQTASPKALSRPSVSFRSLRPWPMQVRMPSSWNAPSTIYMCVCRAHARVCGCLNEREEAEKRWHPPDT